MSVIGKAFLRYSRSILKPAINGLEPLQRVQKLEADVTHLIGVWRELLSVRVEAKEATSRALW